MRDRNRKAAPGQQERQQSGAGALHVAEMGGETDRQSWTVDGGTGWERRFRRTVRERVGREEGRKEAARS